MGRPPSIASPSRESPAVRCSRWGCWPSDASCRRRARPDGHHRPRVWREAVDPLARCDGLTGERICAHGCPVPFGFVLLVGNGTLDDENEGRELALGPAWRKWCQERRALCASSGLRKLIFGAHGIAPRTISSRLDSVAPVSAIVSPSQPRPAVIQRTSISLMTAGTGRASSRLTPPAIDTPLRHGKHRAQSFSPEPGRGCRPFYRPLGCRRRRRSFRWTHRNASLPESTRAMPAGLTHIGEWPHPRFSTHLA